MTNSWLNTSFRGVGKNLNFFGEQSSINEFSFIDIVGFDIAS